MSPRRSPRDDPACLNPKWSLHASEVVAFIDSNKATNRNHKRTTTIPKPQFKLYP